MDMQPLKDGEPATSKALCLAALLPRELLVQVLDLASINLEDGKLGLEVQIFAPY